MGFFSFVHPELFFFLIELLQLRQWPTEGPGQHRAGPGRPSQGQAVAVFVFACSSFPPSASPRVLGTHRCRVVLSASAAVLAPPFGFFANSVLRRHRLNRLENNTDAAKRVREGGKLSSSGNRGGYCSMAESPTVLLPGQHGNLQPSATKKNGCESREGGSEG